MAKGIYKRIKKIIRKPHTEETKERMRLAALKNRIPLKIRFWERVKKTKSCWLWIGTRDAKGYGVIVNNNKHFFAHRLSYEWEKGKIPIKLEIDHLCRNSACINPKHLEAVTHRENVLRGMGLMAVNAKKTYCKYGHGFDKKNTGIKKNKQRYCKKCGAIRSAGVRKKLKQLCAF